MKKLMFIILAAVTMHYNTHAMVARATKTAQRSIKDINPIYGKFVQGLGSYQMTGPQGFQNYSTYPFNLSTMTPVTDKQAKMLESLRTDLLIEAEKHTKDRNFRSAAQAFAQAGNNEKAKKAWFLEGNRLMGERNFELAATAFENAGLSEKAENARSLLRQTAGEDIDEAAQFALEAQKYLESKNYDEAGNMYAKAAMYEEAKKAWALAAQQYIKTGNMIKAAELYNKAGQKEKADTIYITLAETASKEGRYALAENYYTMIGLDDKAMENQILRERLSNLSDHYNRAD